MLGFGSLVAEVGHATLPEKELLLQTLGAKVAVDIAKLGRGGPKAKIWCFGLCMYLRLTSMLLPLTTPHSEAPCPLPPHRRF